MSRLQKLALLSVVWCAVVTVLQAPVVHAAMDPRFELDPRAVAPPKESDSKRNMPNKVLARTVRKKETLNPDKGGVYTVTTFEKLQQLLVKKLGLDDNETGLFLEEIRHENNLLDITRLKSGQKIVIPPVKRHPDGTLKLTATASIDKGQGTHTESDARQTFRLASSAPPVTDQELVGKALTVWKTIIPRNNVELKPLSLQSNAFSLSLDTAHYPTFTRMDGGRIILDSNGTIPPLVKSLIEAKDPSVRILSDTGAGSKQLMASLLGAAGFFSVEENFTMEFGVDPKLTVQADFKVEKKPDSLMTQDMLLVNSGQVAFPTLIGNFLKKEGFALQEPFATRTPLSHHDTRTINNISETQQSKMVDAILSAFAVTSEPNRKIEVFASERNGISLSVNSERYFVRGDKKYVVTSFDGDPINYTLFRILETKGYNVVILQPEDDFRTVSEKFISRMKLSGSYGFHDLLKDTSAGYSLQMSGFKLDDRLLPGGGIFLTDRPMDRIIRDLCSENGYNIVTH